MPKAPKCGVEETLKLNKTLPNCYFLEVYIFERFFLKFTFSIKNPILKMNDYAHDYDFSIQDFVQTYPLQSSAFHSVKGSWK